MALPTLPATIQTEIIQHLPRSDVYNLMTLSKHHLKHTVLPYFSWKIQIIRWRTLESLLLHFPSTPIHEIILDIGTYREAETEMRSLQAKQATLTSRQIFKRSVAILRLNVDKYFGPYATLSKFVDPLTLYINTISYIDRDPILILDKLHRPSQVHTLHITAPFLPVPYNANGPRAYNKVRKIITYLGSLSLEEPILPQEHFESLFRLAPKLESLTVIVTQDQHIPHAVGMLRQFSGRRNYPEVDVKRGVIPSTKDVDIGRRLIRRLVWPDQWADYGVKHDSIQELLSMQTMMEEYEDPF